MEKKPLIGVVGVCASGKSTLIANLTSLGYNCRHIAQEHSYVQDMWQRLTNPDILIFLEVSYPLTLLRRNLNWTVQEYQTQLNRLRHAAVNANIRVSTDNYTPEEITYLILQKLQEFFNY